MDDIEDTQTSFKIPVRKKANEKKGNKLILPEKTWKFYTDDQISSLVIIDPHYHHRHHHHHYYYYYYFITRGVLTRSQSSTESDSQIARTQLKQSILFYRKKN